MTASPCPAPVKNQHLQKPGTLHTSARRLRLTARGGNFRHSQVRVGIDRGI